VKALVPAGADVNFKKRVSHMTPLHWAAFNNDKDVVSYLIAHGAQQTASALRQTPMGIAGNCQNYSVITCKRLFYFRLSKYSLSTGGRTIEILPLRPWP